jgi:hypothetical protein
LLTLDKPETLSHNDVRPPHIKTRPRKCQKSPISFGFPFGLSVVMPPNIPLPTKIVMKVLPPIDIVAEFGEDPDIDEVDAHVRHVMQRALDELAKERRLPVLG